jgi:hypothetical protein
MNTAERALPFAIKRSIERYPAQRRFVLEPLQAFSCFCLNLLQKVRRHTRCSKRMCRLNPESNGRLVVVNHDIAAPDKVELVQLGVIV